ncbi:ArdC-like ssDNA-binding domain-containing protein [Rosistilla oblonga]|uniref:ArdC-like ssDNA-binding domain-containing protein n=1 Tax=Rosistilla oblonga TaxID=2527990 RepID=UPI003A97E2A6
MKIPVAKLLIEKLFRKNSDVGPPAPLLTTHCTYCSWNSFMQATSSKGMRMPSTMACHRPYDTMCLLALTVASKEIISTLRAGSIPWKNEIVNDANSGLPRSVATRKAFCPLNTMLLQIALHRNNFVSRWWGTQSKWQELGGSVDQSTEPTVVYNCDWTPLPLFCIDQVAGPSVDTLRVHDFSIANADTANRTRIDQLVKSSGADIRVGVGDATHSAGNWYVAPNPWIAFPFHSTGDYILLAPPEFHSNPATHHYTLLHELIHWAEVRTNWISDMPMRELVAEIGSGWIATELGCPPCPCRINENKWLERWLWEMRRDSDYVFRAVTQARRAFNFIMSIIEGDKRC